MSNMAYVKVTSHTAQE